MRSMLLFPPGWDPRSPYLALPVLKAYLEEHEKEIAIRDINLDFYDLFFSDTYFKKLGEKFPEVKKNLYWKATEYIDKAKGYIRQKESSAEDKKFAWNIFSKISYLSGKIYDGFEIDFNSLNFKYSYKSTEDVAIAIGDKAVNPLIEYFEKDCFIINEIISSQTDYIGISVTVATQLIPTLTLCSVIRKKCPSVKHIQLGGNFITRIADLIVEGHMFWDYIDSILVYDGEENLLNLIQVLEDNANFSEVNNLYYCDEKSHLVKNQIVAAKAINQLTPNFDGFKLDKYFTDDVWLPLYTSRACLCKCAFCTIPNASGGVYRHMKAEQVVDNIKKLHEKYDIHNFSFVDETFLVPKMKRIATLLNDYNKDISWYCETRFSKLLTLETTEILKRGGCQNIQFGLESYNQRVLDAMKKNIKLDWVEKNIINCLKSGISVHLFFMTGFPTETYEEALNTYRFVDKILNDSKKKYGLTNSTMGFGAFGLEVGSEVYNKPDEYGITILPTDKFFDLDISRNYSASIGLSQKETQTLIQNQKDKFVFENKDLICENPKSIRPSEMEIISQKTVRNKTKVFQVFKDNYESRFYSMHNYISHITKKGFTIFYNMKEDTFLQVFRDEVFVKNNKVYFFSNKLIADFVYYGFIDSSEKKISLVGWDSVVQKNYKLFLNDIIIKKIEGKIFVSNIITNETMITNSLGYELLTFFNKKRSFKEFIEFIKEVRVIIPIDKIVKLLQDGLEQNILKVLDTQQERR